MTVPDLRRRWLIGLLLLLLASTWLRVETVTQRPIWMDEAFTRYNARLGSLSEVWRVSRQQWNGMMPPLHFAVCFLAFRVSDSLFALRLYSVVSGVLTVVLIAMLGSMLFNRTVGIVAGLLLALSVYHINYSQDARPYALVTFLVVAMFLAFFGFLRNEKNTWLAGFVVAGTGAVYTHHFALIAHLPLFLAIAILAVHRYLQVRAGKLEAERLRSLLRFWIVGYGLIGLLYLPLLPQLLGYLTNPERFDPERLTPEPSQHVLNLTPRFFVELLGRWGNGTRWSLVYGACFLTGVALLLRRRDATCVLLLWFVSPFLVFALVPFDKFFDIRYLIWALPVFFLVVAVGLAGIGSGLHRVLTRFVVLRALAARVVPLLLVTVLTAFFAILSINTYLCFRATEVRCSTFHRRPEVMEAHDGFCRKHLILNSLHPDHKFMLRRVDRSRQ